MKRHSYHSYKESEAILPVPEAASPQLRELAKAELKGGLSYSLKRGAKSS